MSAICSALSRTFRGTFCSGGLQSRVRHLCVSTSSQGWKIKDISVPGFERVVHIDDPDSGLKAVIAIHNTTLGNGFSLGGLRIRGDFTSLQEAVTEVTGLAKTMSLKSALGETELGGSEGIIPMYPEKVTQKMLKTLGRFIHTLEGKYIAAEDVNSTKEMMDEIAEETPFVTGLSHPKSSGDPSPFTAWGVFRAMQAANKFHHGTESLAGKKMAVMGLGGVGKPLAEILFWHGARLILSDINAKKTAALANKLGAAICSPKEIHKQECDFFVPCGLGGMLNSKTIAELRCKMVVGSANNQFLDPKIDAKSLKKRGIAHVPDFLAGAGGIKNIAKELTPSGYNAAEARVAVDKIYDTALQVFSLAEKNGRTTYETAVELAEERIQKGIGKRTEPPRFHHYESMKP